MDMTVKDIVEVGKQLYDRQLVSGKAGNVSAKVDFNGKEVIAISPTSASLGNLKDDEIVLVDLDGNVLTKGTPSSEIDLHLKIYNERNDVNAIVHTHSPYATGFAFSPKRIKRHEGFGKIITPFLEEVEYEKPGSNELAEKVVENIGEEDTLILKHHGIVTVSDNIYEAASLAAFIEDTAKTQFISHMLSLTEDIN